jgi:hypothetical protein
VRYGLIAYIKQIYNGGGKCLLSDGTDSLYKADYVVFKIVVITVVESVYSAVRTEFLYKLYKVSFFKV